MPKIETPKVHPKESLATLHSGLSRQRRGSRSAATDGLSARFSLACGGIRVYVMYMYICIYIYIERERDTYSSIHVCAYTHVYAYVYVYIVCMCVYIYIYICIYITYIHIYNTCIYTYRGLNRNRAVCGRTRRQPSGVFTFPHECP